MIEKRPLSIDDALDYKKARPDIAAGVVCVVAAGIPVYVTEEPLKTLPEPSLEEKWADVRERLQPKLENLRSNSASRGVE